MPRKKHWLDRVIFLLQADTYDLRELAKMAGGNPKTFYRGIKRSELEKIDQNLDGMEFSDSESDDLTVDGQLSLPGISRKYEYSTPVELLKSKSQEERIAIILSNFLKDRSVGMWMVSHYAETEMPAFLAIRIIKEIYEKEQNTGKLRDVRIARKISGVFSRHISKRVNFNFYMAKHINWNYEIILWLRGKSYGMLSKRKTEELRGYLK
jgi:hypothetical protein